VQESVVSDLKAGAVEETVVVSDLKPGAVQDSVVSGLKPTATEGRIVSGFKPTAAPPANAAAPASAPRGDAASLIAEASDLLDRATWGSTRAAECRIAADIAEKGIKLLKAEPVPTESAAKDEYTSTLLTGLSVRAEALGLVAANVDRSQVGAAEMAYREYLAAESSSAKKASAQHKLAAMYTQLKELEKAKGVYENLLALNPTDRRALTAMVSIYQDIAAAQNVAGQNADAEISNKLAKSYSDRLSDLNVPSKADADAGFVDREINTKSAGRREVPNSDSSRPKAEPVEKKGSTVIRKP
jgi:hypothetical protein